MKPPDNCMMTSAKDSGIGLRPFLLVVYWLLTIHLSNAQSFPLHGWQHISIDSILPGSSYGTGGFTLADFDRDGDLDITISRRLESGLVFWYQNLGNKWERHNLGIADLEQLGATTTDISGDGYPDLVMGRFWFENPGTLSTNPGLAWLRHAYSGGLDAENHDMATCDFTGDGRAEILSYSQKTAGGTLRIFSPDDPGNWTYTNVAEGINATAANLPQSNGIHGGFAPCGTGDLDNDQFADIVMPAGWYKNPGATARGVWLFNPWPFHIGITPNLYGLSIRSWVIDLDTDGDHDIVFTDCDTEGSQGYWIENINRGNEFVRHALPSPGDPTGSFHSLAVADFDLDGDPDIFAGEQEDPDKGMKPEGLDERGIFWVNTGNAKSPSFNVKILHAGNPGWHDVQMGDVDGDGDMDLVSKVWNKDGMYYHVDFWKNLVINTR